MRSLPAGSAASASCELPAADHTAAAAADELGRRLLAAVDDAECEVRILGPAPAPMAKLRGTFRYQIQLQSADGEPLRVIVVRATADLKMPDGVHWTADVDPLDMM